MEEPSLTYQERIRKKYQKGVKDYVKLKNVGGKISTLRTMNNRGYPMKVMHRDSYKEQLINALGNKSINEKQLI